MSENYILLTENSLRKILREELVVMMTGEEEVRENFSIDEAVNYLNSKGYKVTKNTLYGHTSRGSIEFKRWGERKITFTKKQLDDFIEKMTR